MVKIIERKEITNPDKIARRFWFSGFQDDIMGIYQNGLYCEYVENDLISFKFLVINNVVTIYESTFTSLLEGDLEMFFKNEITKDKIFSWVSTGVTLDYLPRIEMKSWKYKYEIDFVSGEEELWKDTKGDVMLQNTKTIHLLPDICRLFYYIDTDDMLEREYWINLWRIKEYVNRKYKGSDQESE